VISDFISCLHVLFSLGSDENGDPSSKPQTFLSVRAAARQARLHRIFGQILHRKADAHAFPSMPNYYALIIFSSSTDKGFVAIHHNFLLT
jgi:hypothetical protein